MSLKRMLSKAVKIAKDDMITDNKPRTIARAVPGGGDPNFYDKGRRDFISIGGIGGDDGASGPNEDIRPLQPPITRPPRRLLPPDISVMAD